MYYPRFTKVIIHHFLTKDKTISKRNKIGMHTSRDDYLINTLRFVSTKEESQIYGARLPKSLTSPEMWESKAYKTYLGYATGATPPKKARKFKKPTSPQLTIVPVSPEEPTRKKKSLRDFHKTHPSGSGTITKTALSAAKIKPSITNEGTGVKPGVPDVTEEESTESEAESWGKDEEDNNNEHNSRSEGSDQERDSGDEKAQSDKEEEDEFVKTSSNDTDDEDETNIKDKTEGDEDEGMDYATNQFDDDVNVRLNEPVETDEGFIQKEGTDAEMTNKTKVPVTSSSYSSDLAFKFLNFLDIPHIDAEIVSPMDAHVHHEVPSKQTPTLLTVLVSVITDSSPVYSTVIPQSLPSFTPPPQQSTLTPPTTTKATYPLSTLPNFASIF
ncbi:hypothetical protein Tco_0906940 [Tanacetum coccineum]|uniref:Uncharacterized protein n=1 Tax=Tanacetum coccineum TaxID=301880 RepID=A0ABQ5CI17_9ASTR